MISGCHWARWCGKEKLLPSAGQGGKAKHMYEIWEKEKRKKLKQINK